jgi:cobalt-zinc-cadmium efflux system outer membrane protein
MRGRREKLLVQSFVLMIASGCENLAWSEESAIGSNIEQLLDFARQNNPEYAVMRHEADAAGERIVPAGALPDPKFRTELQDITKMGEQDLTLLPGEVGKTKYTLMQDLPWYGKRDLQRGIAELEAKSAQGRVRGRWAELAARIKSTHARLYYVHQNARLVREILDLTGRLEKVAQVRYAGGLGVQQDVIRAQIEQTGMRNELLELDGEYSQLRARTNALLARPAGAALADPGPLRPLPAVEKLDFLALEERIRTGNPQIFVEETKIRSAEMNRELTYKNRYPDFTVGLSPIQYGNSIDDWEVMFELNIPLQQSARRAQEREAESMLAAAHASKQAASNRILGQLAESLSAIEAARQAEWLMASSLVPQAELTFNSALAAYENGKVDFATLLEAQKQIRQARQNRIRAQVEAQMRLAEVEMLLGEDL